MAKEQAPGFDSSSLPQQIFEDLPGWLQDLARVETHEDLAAVGFPQPTSDAIRAIADQLRAERANVVEQHERQLQADRNALQQTLNRRQQRLRAYDELTREDTLAGAEDKFVVAGRIVDEGGVGLPGVRVSAFDVDREYDDELGEIRTDMMGFYRLEYEQSAIRNLPDEKPKAYIEVLDEDGEQLHASTKSFVHQAGEVVEIDVSLPEAGRVPRSQALSKMLTRLIDDHVENLEQRKRRFENRMAG